MVGGNKLEALGCGVEGSGGAVRLWWRKGAGAIVDGWDSDAVRSWRGHKAIAKAISAIPLDRGVRGVSDTYTAAVIVWVIRREVGRLIWTSAVRSGRYRRGVVMR